MKLYFRNSDNLRLAGILTIPKKTTKTCIVLCHGATVDKEEGGVFTYLSKRLAKEGFAVFRFDFRGHGESQGRSVDMTIKDQQDDIDNALDTLIERGYKRFGLVAASFAGISSTYYASRHQNRIKGLVYWNAVIKTHTLLDRWHKADKENNFEKKGFILRGNVKYGRSLVKDLERLRPEKELKNIKIPVFFIHGDKDSSVPHKEALALANEIDADMETVHGAKHGFHNKRSFKVAAEKAALFFSKVLDIGA